MGCTGDLQREREYTLLAMSRDLSPFENCAMGFVSGGIEVTALQSMNYWKNASQQRLPFTMNPQILYRGYPSNLMNMGSGTMWQFAACGAAQRALLADEDRALSMGEELASGLVAGVSSGLLVGPLELMMIQQQVKGGSIPKRAKSIGLSRVYRGIVPAAGREGLWALGYLSFPPIIRTYLCKHHASTFQGNEEMARLAASVFGALISCAASHPFDTVKTCMQGDIEKSAYEGSVQTARSIVRQGGIAALYRGFGWRYSRQVLAIFILDKARQDLAPFLFPG